LSTRNYVLFDKDGKIKKYGDEVEILSEFYWVRYELYGKRKEYCIKELKREQSVLENKKRFIVMINDGAFKFNNIPKDELIQILSDK